MHHDPASDLKALVVQTLTGDFQVTGEEANRVAAQVGMYLGVEDVGDAHFELLNVTLTWHALCGAVAAGEIALSGGFAGLPLVGVLRWFDGMRSYHQFNAPYAPHREALDLGHIEAATCIALWRQEGEAHPYSPDDTMEALHERVNAVLRETVFGPIDKQRLEEAMDRLQTLRCLTPRAGWHRLRAEMKFQMPEE